MYRIDDKTKKIYLTRGDVACIRISAKNDDGGNYTFRVGDVIRFKVFKKKDCQFIVLQKDTKIGNIINKDIDYWYEVELNPDTRPQTIIGYEIDPQTRKPLEKIFKLLPEGGDIE